MSSVDKRTINGNNGTVRTKDKKQRKRPSGYYVLKDEVRAGLRARLEMLLDFFGTKANIAKQLKVTPQTVEEWFNRGMISARGAHLSHNYYKRTGEGFRATFCRPDLQFDGNGKPLTLRCKKRHMLRVVTEAELATKPECRSWRKIKAANEAARKAKDISHG